MNSDGGTDRVVLYFGIGCIGRRRLKWGTVFSSMAVDLFVISGQRSFILYCALPSARVRPWRTLYTKGCVRHGGWVGARERSGGRTRHVFDRWGVDEEQSCRIIILAESGMCQENNTQPTAAGETTDTWRDTYRDIVDTETDDGREAEWQVKIQLKIQTWRWRS